MRVEHPIKVTAPEVPPKVVFFVLFLALLWGGNAVSLKIGLKVFAPLASAGIRFAIAFALIVGWAVTHGIPLKPDRREYLPLLLSGLLFTAQIVSFNWGTHLTYAGRSVVMINTYPLFVAGLAHFFVPGDSLSRRKATGLLLAFVGVLVVFQNNLRSGNSDARLAGDALTLLSGFQLGALIVITNRLIQRIHPYLLLISQMAVGIPIFFILSVIFEGSAGYGFSYPALFAILYQGVVVAGFCFVAWTQVLKRYPPSRLTVLFFTTPLWGLMWSYLLLGERVSLELAVGAVLVAFGIYTVTSDRQRGTV